MVDLARINYVIITLVPIVKDAKQIQKFRPISLLNVSFKIGQYLQIGTTFCNFYMSVSSLGQAVTKRSKSRLNMY